MDTRKKLWLGSGSTVAMVGTVVLMGAAPAAADMSTTVTPSTGLTDEQIVEVFVDSGIAVGAATADNARVEECAPVASGIQCSDVGTIAFSARETASRGEYTWDGLARLPQLLLLPSDDLVAVCHSQCFVRVIGSFDNGTTVQQVGSDVPLQFIGPK
jgi:hypothetical protein